MEIVRDYKIRVNSQLLYISCYCAYTHTLQHLWENISFTNLEELHWDVSCQVYRAHSLLSAPYSDMRAWNFEVFISIEAGDYESWMKIVTTYFGTHLMESIYENQFDKRLKMYATNTDEINMGDPSFVFINW